MDPTTLAGVAVLIAKLAAFALLVVASRRASAAVAEIEARRAREAMAAAEAAPALSRADSEHDARALRLPEPA